MVAGWEGAVILEGRDHHHVRVTGRVGCVVEPVLVHAQPEADVGGLDVAVEAGGYLVRKGERAVGIRTRIEEERQHPVPRLSPDQREQFAVVLQDGDGLACDVLLQQGDAVAVGIGQGAPGKQTEHRAIAGLAAPRRGGDGVEAAPGLDGEDAADGLVEAGGRERAAPHRGSERSGDLVRRA